MGWDVGANGLPGCWLGAARDDREVPADDVTRPSRRRTPDRSTTSSWVSHPGGPKVIEAIHVAPGAPDGELRADVAVAGEVGNLSSASVLHVPRDTLCERPPAAAGGMPTAMGPGFRSALSYCSGTDEVADVPVYPADRRCCGRMGRRTGVVKRNMAWSRARGGRRGGRTPTTPTWLRCRRPAGGRVAEVRARGRPFIPGRRPILARRDRGSGPTVGWIPMLGPQRKHPHRRHTRCPAGHRAGRTDCSRSQLRRGRGGRGALPLGHTAWITD